MTHFTPRVLALSAAGAWVALLFFSRNEVVERRSRRAPQVKSADGKHYPTPEQLTEAGAFTDRLIEPIRARADDGSWYDWPATRSTRPLVLFFIKRDCPCNVEFEPYFHRLEKQYGDVAEFAGVIDSDVETARSYAIASHLSHRVLADPGRAIIARLEARNGGYVALLRPQGEIDALWPGCSAEMIRQLGGRIAALTAVTERPVDVTGAPRVLTTGCPFAS
jgi:peroxiredoxin